MIPRLIATSVAFCFASVWALDLSRAVIVAPQPANVQERKAVAVLVEEIANRTQSRLTVAHALPADGTPSIVVGTAARLEKLSGVALGGLPPAVKRADGFRIAASGNSVIVAGNDQRGTLFGIGYLLRKMEMRRGGILRLADSFRVATAPVYPLRGHQLGYRPKVNSYDGFTVAMWDQYIRDLAIFGTNSIELIPPRSDDADDSPHFPLPKLAMMTEMSRICDEYGLDVWIWYPAMDKDYSDPKTVEFALKEWEQVYKALPRIDYIFVPGGDPGHTEPKYLFALLEKQTALLHKYHPKAQMWMSPQSFSEQWFAEFYDLMKQEPKWLSGIVCGPQTREEYMTLAAKLPKRYALRNYPDITHSLHSQFPVPDWDVAFAVTEGRETINPRPTQERAIFRKYMDFGEGFLTYSEGVNDDVNKIVWSGLGWNPDTPVVETLRDFGAYFIGEDYRDSFAQGLMALERDWMGPLLTNLQLDSTFAAFQDMEAKASPQVKLNWRFQQALYRAYYDSFVRDRLIYETALQTEAMSVLRQAREIGAANAMAQAEGVLNRALLNPVASTKRQRIFELAEALYQSIHMQLSVAKYQAIAVGRGANLDTVDTPLNSRRWLENQFAEIRQVNRESERVARLDAIVNWTDAGPGGFYDDLGDIAAQPHLVRALPYDKDPMFVHSPMMSFAMRGAGNVDRMDQSFLNYPKSWWTHAEALFDGPVTLEYKDLDPTAQYRVKVVYGGDNFASRLKMVANDNTEVHGWLHRPVPFHPLEFDIPRPATAGGVLKLSVYKEPGSGGAGRGDSVSEVWLMRK